MTHDEALLLVDLQNDFCDGGALAVPDADSAIGVAGQLMARCQHQGIPVVASLDWHPVQHGSFASVQGATPFTEGKLDGLPQTWWPDHCVQGTPGARLHSALQQSLIAATFPKGEDPNIDSYSAFFDNGHRQETALHGWLQQHAIRRLTVTGLATDYCVKYTVLDALRLGYQVTVIPEGCRGVNLAPQDSKLAFEEMESAGAHLLALHAWLNKYD